MIRSSLAALGLAALVLVPAHPVRAQSDLVARGRYLATIGVCTDCHTDGTLAGKPDPSRYLAGSTIGFEVPGFGIVYGKNLTPDAETGLGTWTDEEIVRAFKQGQGRDGRSLAPIMPWHAYTVLSDEDTRALVAFLRSLTPVRFAPPANVKPGEKPISPYMTVVPPK
jgi:mono/diheme cytochrome c family protein